VKSTPGRGTVIRVFFPLRRDRLQPLATRPPAQAEAVSPGKRTILLVEDDEALRTTIQEVLERILGYTVWVARDGLEGIEVFQENLDRVDLILMDASMPRMNGAEAFERIKELRPGAKAILSSGFSEDLGGAEARAHGFLGFLKKPYTLRELAGAIEKALTP